MGKKNKHKKTEENTAGTPKPTPSGTSSSNQPAQQQPSSAPGSSNAPPWMQQSQQQNKPPGQPLQQQNKAPGQPQQQQQNKPSGQPQQQQWSQQGQQQNRGGAQGQQQQQQNKPSGQPQQQQWGQQGQQQNRGGAQGQQQQQQNKPSGQPQQQQWGQQGQQQNRGGAQGQQQQQNKPSGQPQQQQWGQQGQQQNRGGAQGQQQQQYRGGPQGQQQQNRGGPQGRQQQYRSGPQGDQNRGGPQGQHQQYRGGPQQSQGSHSGPQSRGSSLSGSMGALAVVPTNVAWQPGTRGRSIKVEVNYLKLALEKLVNMAYHYDVTFEPDKPKKFLQRALDMFQRKNFPKTGMAFDGRKNAYTSQILPMKASEFSDSVTVVCEDTGREKSYKITIKKVNDIDLLPLKNYVTKYVEDTPHLALQVIDVVLRAAHNRPGVVQWKRSFFDVNIRHDPLGRSDFELWYGLFQAAVLGWKPYINIDVSHKAFPMPTPIIRMIDPGRFDQRDIYSLEKRLNGLNFVYTPPDAPTNKRMYRFYGINKPANQTFFEQNGKRMSVADYFKAKGCPLKYPNLPVLRTAGTAQLPLEFCTIAPNQATNKSAPEECKRDMIKFAAIPTFKRKENIMRMVNTTCYNSSAIIKEFGITVGTEFEKIDARILPSPALEYAGKRQLFPRSGVWRADNDSFLAPKIIQKWYIINMERNRVGRSELENFAKSFQSMGSKLKMKIEPPTDINEQLDYRSNAADIEKVLCTMKDAELVVCVVPETKDAYARIKQVSELKLGILTQCIKSRTFGRMDPSCVNNILLKVNAKVNGVNHRIGDSNNNKSIPKLLGTNLFMFIGADVTHPSPDQTTIPSLVGVAASSDIDGFQYNCCYRIQGPRVEMIENFGDIVKQHLNVFRQKNQNKLPELIVYYRDGVSDGQFDQLRDIELVSMRKACAEIQQGYKPKISLLVVQKRHHTRFFPILDADSDGKNRNVIPGTVVDKEIVDVQKKQFFLVAHASIQGVAKPAKYQVICDDSNFSADLLEELTYSLCHLFTRCNRTVSYVAPTYYAHLVAFRARSYIHDDRLNMAKLKEEYNRRQINVNFTTRNPMFFV